MSDSEDSARLRNAIKQLAKWLGSGSAVAGGGLAYAWFSTSPPRNMWFQQETVTVTQTVSPWWMGGVTVVVLALIVWSVWMMLQIGPRGFH